MCGFVSGICGVGIWCVMFVFVYGYEVIGFVLCWWDRLFVEWVNYGLGWWLC